MNSYMNIGIISNMPVWGLVGIAIGMFILGALGRGFRD